VAEVAQSINEILKLQWQLLVPHVGFALSHQIKMLFLGLRVNLKISGLVERMI
jgi:hypothetical protein